MPETLKEDVVFAVSDGSGGTARRVIQAALTQFESPVDIRQYKQVLTRKEIRRIIREASAAGALVVHTLVTPGLRQEIFDEGRKRHVPTLDLMGPLLERLSDQLQAAPKAQPGLYSTYGSEEYNRRIEAMDYAFRHDDGRRTEELEQAEIVLVGISRTGKTPLSVYLAYRGWFVGNVPIILGIEPPEILFRIPAAHVIGLTIEPRRLAHLRQARATRMASAAKQYVNESHVMQETSYARMIFRRGNWRTVDMTSKPIEEAMAEIVALIG
ncbi:MAG: kinase/pyrophosphorylase [Anaerolineae bacterium]|nr:kinase/pyrophosphorylase [Anaerolineae bacterium]